MSACPKCDGNGWYHYDHNHSKPCELCCRHNKGVWWLTDLYGARADDPRWCCLQGCGAKWRGIVDYQEARR